MSEAQKVIGPNEEMTAEEIARRFAEAGIDPSVRGAVLPEISPLVQQVHDICAAQKVPFLIAIDVSDAESIAEGKSLCMSSVNLPGGIVSNLLRQACEVFRHKDEFEQQMEQFSADNLFLELQKEGLSEHPELTRAKWIEQVNAGETDLGYWQWLSACFQRSIEQQMSKMAVDAVQQALAGDMPE